MLIQIKFCFKFIFANYKLQNINRKHFFNSYRVLFSDRDEAKLIIDLERQLSNQTPNMTDLRNIMYSLDRNRNDFLSSAEVIIS